MTDDYKTIDPDTLDPRDAYRLNISLLVPRPIAWVASIGPDGVFNCAPFSFFMGVSSSPPVIAFAVGDRRTGPKDTVRHIEAHPEFTVNICSEALGPKMVQTSADYPTGVSEFEEAGLTPLPSDLVKPPRIGGTPVQMECKLHQLYKVEETSTTMILGRVVRYHIMNSVLDDKGEWVDIHRLKPLGRLGGNQYCRISDVIELIRREI